MNWNAELAYYVTPKSGPMRPMQTLRDANYAFLDDLSARCRLRGYWFRVGRLLMAAANTGSRLDILLATDALVMALETEGWLTRVSRESRSRTSERSNVISLTPPHGMDGMLVPIKLAA